MSTAPAAKYKAAPPLVRGTARSRLSRGTYLSFALRRRSTDELAVCSDDVETHHKQSQGCESVCSAVRRLCGLLLRGKSPSRLTAGAHDQTDVFAPNSPSLRLVTWQLYRLFLSALTLLHLISSSSAQSCIDHDRATRALYAALQTIGHLVQRVPGVASYETILGELIKGWETRRHAPISQIPVTHHPELARHATTSASHSQAMRASQTATPGLNNQQSMASGMNWNAAVPANQPGPVNAEWMTALLDNGNFGQNGLSHAASHYPMSNDQASGSGSGSGSVSGSGQYGYHNGQQTLSEDMGNSWTPLFGSPRSTEAFSDQWGGALIQMGGQVAGPVRDDFFELVFISSLRVMKVDK